LEYLAELGRIELAESEKSKLLKDLQEILNYFQELQKIDTTDVEPMSGGTFTQNIFREDEGNVKRQASSVKLTEAFPEKENDFLKIPPVFK
jgi:aspartyl-tRNA(Asn)/glutamyl-tRNA(Gln) amidotransferase subunit C